MWCPDWISIDFLTLCMQGEIFSRQHFEIYTFFFFFHKIGFDIFMQIVSLETISMNGLFSRKNKKKNITTWLSVELAKKW